jgi:putative endonuclease
VVSSHRKPFGTDADAEARAGVRLASRHGIMPANARVELGKWGEECACRELRRRGYVILERRYRTRFGEIDIVATDGGVLVFVEVKARRGVAFGTPAEAVTRHKQRRLLQLAAMYLAARRVAADVACRFDVVSISCPPGVATPQILLLKHAFDHSAAGSW